MANIATYQQPNLGLNPSEIGVESTAAAARRGGAFFHQAAQSISDTGQRVGSAERDLGTSLDLVVTHRQISQGSLEFSKLIAQSTADWHDAYDKADPHDPSAAGKFREEVLEPRLQKFLDSFDTQQGQAWAQNHVNQLRQHFVEKTIGDMATKEGIAVRTGIQQQRDTDSNTAYMDPSTVPFLLDNGKSTIQGTVASSPNLRGTEGTKIETELLEKYNKQVVMAGVLGAIRKSQDPDAVVAEWTKRYPQYINAQEIDHLSKTATAQQKANVWYDRQNELLAKQQATEDGNRELSKLWTDSVRFDESGRAVIKSGFLNGVLDVATKYPGAVDERAKSFINWAQAEQRERKQAIVTDPATHQQLYDGLFNQTKPTTDVDIFNARAQGKLSDHDTSALHQLWQSLQDRTPKDPVFRAKMDAVKEKLGVGLVGDGHERYASFIQQFLPEYLKQKQAGTLPANALNMNDEKSLIGQWVKQFAPDDKERMMLHMLKRLGIQRLEDLNPSPSNEPAPKVGDTKRFKQGVGRWDGSTWVPAGE